MEEQEETTTFFPNVPTGHDVTLIALKYVDNQPYIARRRTKISEDGVSNLLFEKVTIERLKTVMEEINQG